MQMRFAVDDEDVAHTAREELVGRFEKWLEGHPEHGEADAWDADLLLEWKFGYGDRDYGHWTRLDVDEVLLEHLPRKLSASPDDAASIPLSLAAFVGFLDDEGLLDERSETAQAVATRALSQTRTFLDAMADPQNFGMAKRLVSAAGIDEDAVPDQAELDAAMARFNELSYEERGEILGRDEAELGPDDGEADLDLPPLPLRDMPSAADLAGLVGRAPLVYRIVAFTRALGPDGIELTEEGEPQLDDACRLAQATGVSGADRVADVRSVTELPELLSLGRVAIEVGAADVLQAETPPRLVPVADWSKKPIADQWQASVDAVLALGAATLSARELGPEPLVELTDQVTLHVLAMLWVVSEPVPLREFGAMLQEATSLERPTARIAAVLEPEALERLCDTLLLAALVSLAGAGVVTLDDRDDTVTLTDAGARLVAPALAEVGFDSRLPEDIAGLTAAELLDTLVGRGGTDVEIAADFWTRGRAAPPLAADLVAALVARPEPARVMIGFGMLDHLGAEAVEAVRGALDGPVAAHAWLFLAAQGAVPPEDVPPGLVVEAAIEIFVATADLGAPADVVEMVLGNIPAPEHTVFVDELTRADHPRTGELLETLGRHHPDRAVAKHARKAAHRWRSGRGRPGEAS